MKKKHAIIAGLLLTGSLLAWLGVNVSTPVRASYGIVSSVPYDASLCCNTLNESEPGGYNAALKAVLKDRDTGKKLEGYAGISTGSSRSSLSTDEKYSCIEQAGSKKMIAYAYSNGYAPQVVSFEPPDGRMVELQITLTKNCSGGLSCFDNVWTEYDNQTRAAEEENNAQDIFYERIKEAYGLEKPDYALTCAECDLNRGGYIKAKGTYKDGTPMELYYHWGWGSSSGADGGWRSCFASGNERLFEAVKNWSCSALSDYSRIEDTSVPGVMSMTTAEDNTNETIEECLNGRYDGNMGDLKAFSIIQNSNRYVASVAKGDTDCLAN